MNQSRIYDELLCMLRTRRAALGHICLPFVALRVSFRASGGERNAGGRQTACSFRCDTPSKVGPRCGGMGACAKLKPLLELRARLG